MAFVRESKITNTYKTMWQVLEESVDLIRPGRNPQELLKFASEAYRKVGIKGVRYQGHGIGLEARENPVVLDSPRRSITDQVVRISSDIPFEKGMIMNIETPLVEIGEGEYQIERTFRLGSRTTSEITPSRANEPFVAT
jgi:Xaa-Pro aminopeptidase